MKTNRIMWGFVVMVVLTTIAVTLGTLDSHSQKKNQPTPTRQDDLSKYAIVDYDAIESTMESEKAREERRIKSERYNGQHWVLRTPHPADGMVGRYDEVPIPDAIPAKASDLIIIGQITTANAFLSTDKRSVYTEFTVCIEDLLRGNGSNDTIKGSCLTVDREGGYVRYSNGQKVLYRISGKDLPRVGSTYLLFLTNDKKSVNYTVFTGYELTQNSFAPLDREIDLGDLSGTEKRGFINAVRLKISQSSNSPNEKENKQ